MTPTHIIFSLVSGKLVAGVVQIPEEPEGYSGMSDGVKQFYFMYQEELKQALSNPVLFRDEKDTEAINKMIYDVHSPSWMPCDKIHKDWQPEIGKPYDIPEGMNVEIRDIQYPMPDRDFYPDLHPDFEEDLKRWKECKGFKQFAFLKAKQQEQCDECDHLRRPCSKHRKKRESQDELWNELVEIGSLIADDKKMIEVYKSRFLITRI